MMYNRSNWYWLVAGNTTQVYSSATGAYVPSTDATYEAWLASGGIPTRISADDMLKIQIDILEATQTPRRLREAANGTDGGWLKTLDAEIVALRTQLSS